MRYRPELDGLRALAVLAVMASHSMIGNASGGWMGVDIFFVLSGYLITTLLVTERDSVGRVSLPRFYARRALRLYPALLVLIVGGLPFYRWLGDGGTLSGYGIAALNAGTYVSDLTLGLHGSGPGQLGHTWSLSIEEQFYLLWPPLLIWLLARGRDPLRRAAVGVLVSWTLLVAGSDGGTFEGLPKVYVLPWDRFGELLAGCCVALVLLRRPVPAWLGRQWVGWSLAGTAALLLLAGSRAHLRPNIGWEAPAIALVTAAMLLHLHDAARGITVALRWRPLEYIGRRSYGLYLYHVPIFAVIQPRVHFGKLGNLALVSAISFVVAIASYRFVEQPFLRLKHRRFEPPSHRPEPVPT